MSKATLYANSLDLARRLSLFPAVHPVDAHGRVSNVGGAAGGEGADGGMDWKELVRKFGKHVVGREVTAQAALAEQTLHQLLSRAALSTSYHPDRSNASPTLSLRPLSTPLISPTDRPTALTALETLAGAIKNGSGSSVDRDSARVVRAWGLYGVGEFGMALEELGGVEKGCPKGEAEGYDLALRVLANVVEGYANERLGRVEEAVEAYRRAGRVYNDACDILARSGGTKNDVELHKHGEDALFRLCLLSRSTPNSAFIPHRLYLKHSSHWTSSRPTKSLVIHRSFRTLLHAAGPTPDAESEWFAEVAANNKAQEALLRTLTSLPLAGEINRPYLEFLDDVAEGWRIGGAGAHGATEVVEILYNALTHTFQSQRLLRHLVRVLAARGSHVEAGKALRLYVDLFDKARETDAAQVARNVRKFRARTEGGKEEGEEGVDIDSDREFVVTMGFGTRLCCRYLEDPGRGLALATRAKEVFEEGKEKGLVGDKVVESRIECALGIALGALTAKEADLETRPDQHARALKHLERASLLDPSSWETLYHLSYQLAELRQITPALDCARRAVQLNGESREAWHLLGLLVAAQKDLGAALQVLETALDEEEGEEEGETTAPTTSGGLSFVGRAAPNGVQPTTNGNGTVDADAKLASLPSNKSAGNQFDFPRDDTELLATEVLIRMTKNVVIEAMEGPAAALLDQQALLTFFSLAFKNVKDVSETTKAVPVTVSTAATARRASVLGSKRSTARTVNGDPAGSTLSVAQPATRAFSIRSRNSTTFAPPVNESFSTLSIDDSPRTPPSPSSSSSMSPSLESNPRATKLLVDLWLMSAASFRRAGKLEESRGAIQEAESLDADDPDVWAQFALYSLATSDVEQARTSLIKALSFSVDHIPSIILLSRLYLSTPGKIPFAEGLLDTLTTTQGWDIPEAWFELSKCHKGMGRMGKEKECLVWALQLEETRSVRTLRSAVPRLL